MGLVQHRAAGGEVLALGIPHSTSAEPQPGKLLPTLTRHFSNKI